MSSLHRLQEEFIETIFENSGALFGKIKNEGDITPSQRMQIYRNNAFLILTETLKNIFPATCRLIDESFFNYAANEFIKQSPPNTTDLNNYGAELPDFLASFRPLKDHPYVPDVAKFEWIRHELYLAPDTPHLEPGELIKLTPEETQTSSLKLRPCAQIFKSMWAIDQIWEFSHTDSNDTPDMNPYNRFFLIFRKDNQIKHWDISETLFSFIQHLDHGETIENAFHAAHKIDKNFDAQTHISHLLAAKIFLPVKGGK